MAVSTPPTNTAKKKFFFSLRSQILACFLGLFYFCLGLITLAYLFGIPNTNFPGIIKETERKSFSQLNLIADLKKERLQKWLEERRSDIRLLANNELMIPLLKSLYQEIIYEPNPAKQQQVDYQRLQYYLKDLQNSYKVYAEISIYDNESGRLLVSTDSKKVADDLGDPHIKMFSPGADEYIALEAEDDGQLFLEMHRYIKVTDETGHLKFKAVIKAKINTDGFIKPILHTGEALGNSGETLLVTQDRKIVTSLKHSLPDGSKANLLSYQISASPARFAAGGHDGFISALDYRGIPVLAAYRHIQITTELTWGMVVKIDREEVFSELKNNIVTLLTMISAACLLIAFCSYFLSRRLSHSVANMVKVAKKVESGTLNIRVNETGNDEIGSLALSFNRMISQLQQWNEKLERQIAARTADLKETADKLYKEIDERKAAEEEVRLQSEIMNRMAEGVCLLRIDGIIIYANPGFEEMFGYVPGEMIGKHASIINHPEAQIPGEAASGILEILNKDGVWQGEIQNIRKDGTPVWCQTSVIVFKHSQHGKVIIAVHNDITKRKRVEDDKALLETRLLQAQKMEAIGTLAGGIAHDFNNILSVIIGYTDMAKEDAPDDTKLASDLNNVLDAGNRAKDLVKQILAFSRQAKVERIPVQLTKIINETLKMLRSSLPSTIEIHEDLQSRGDIILADATQIHQIIMNLCGNALHAMEETGGILAIEQKSTRIDKGDRQQALNIEPGEYSELIVSDSGTGISPDIIDKIFDPYFTTKELDKGTGMGLAIIHGIIADYGGTITVESEHSKGTTFHVFFPVLGQEDMPHTTGVEKEYQGKERILFVDDEEILANLGKDMLERLGYQVTVRHNSLDALSTFQNCPDDFDVIITDQTMPGMTGADLARRMLQIRPDIPIILCTGYSNIIDENSAKALGIKEFALKPLTRNSIAMLIRKVLDEPYV